MAESNISKDEVFPMYEDMMGGIFLVFSNKFEIADEFYETHKSNNPRASLHWAESMLIRSVLSELQSDKDAALDRMTATLKLAEEQLKVLEAGNIPKGRSDITKQNINNYIVDTRTVLADAHTMTAGLLVLEDARVKGLIHLRKGWKLYRSTLDKVESNKYGTIHPAVFNSLKFGAGLFYFIISLIPPGLPQKVASLAGFKSGDNFKELGMKFLRDVHSSSSIRCDLAGIVLACHHLLLTNDMDPKIANELVAEANSIYKEGLGKFPKGSVFQVIASFACLETNNTDEAIKHTEASINNCRHVTNYPALLLRLKSQCYIMRFEWETATKILEDILGLSIEQAKLKKKSSNNAWALIYNNLRAGCGHMMLGNQDKAKKYFTTTTEQKTTDKWSESLVFQAKRYLANGGFFSMLENMILTEAFEKVIRNAKDTQRQEILNLIEELAKKAKGALTPITKDTKASSTKVKDMNDPLIDNRVAYCVLRATVLRTLQKTEEADVMIKEVLDANQNGLMKDKLYYTLALIEAGKNASRANNTEQATKYYETAMKINKVIWEMSIKRRIRICMKQIGVEAVEVVDEEDEKNSQQYLNSDEIKEIMREDSSEM